VERPKARQEDLSANEKRAVRKLAGILKSWSDDRVKVMAKFAKELIT
jgi:hypothetical protein